jgi:flagellar biogenesis protein FliO
MTRWLLCVLLASASLAARADAIPYKQDSAVAAAALPGGALGVLLLSAAAIGAVYVLRKRLNLQPPGKGGARHVRVLETQRLGPRTLLSVVEFGGSQYLIAQSEHGVTCLASAPDAAADKEPA